MNITTNNKELAALQKFRASVSDILEPKHDDAFLLRWLTARNLDTEKADQMLRKSMEWRKQNNMDKAIDNVPSEFLKRYFPVGQLGYDKEGCPIIAVPLGYYDIRGLIQSVKPEDLVKRFEITMEISLHRMQEQSEKLGKPIMQHCIIGDLQNFGISHFLWKPAFNFLKNLVKTNDNNYPETLKMGIIINAPKIFQVCFSLLKPFIHENTQNKIKIYGKDGWKEALHTVIDPTQIPEIWGGTYQESPNGNWWDVLSMPSQIPPSYYKDSAKRLSAEQGTKSITINSQEHFSTDIAITEPGTVLKWIFQTEDSDIGFGINLVSSTGKEEVIPVARVDSHLFPEEGSIVCDKIGTYEVNFDNKFSYLRSKKLAYKLDTLEPERH